MYAPAYAVPSIHDLAEALILAIDRAGIGVTVLAQRGEAVVRTFSSAGLCELSGWSADELAAMPATALIAPTERSRMVALRDTMLRGGPLPTRLETVIEARDGTQIPVELAIASVHGPDGLASVLFFRDLRADHRIQDALRESEARFRSLAEASPDSIIVVAGGRFIYANPATAAVLGYSVAEVLALPFEQLLVHPEETAEMRARMQRIARGERLPPREYAGRRRDGGVAVLEISSTPIIYDGAPALLSIGRDTSERRALHAELMRADRLATLGMLAAGVAHEINNPLTYTLIHLEQLAMTVPPLIADPISRGRIETMIAEAREGGQRVSTIVRELLTVARHDREALPSAVEAAIDAAIRLAGPTISERARVARRGEPVPLVRANPGRLSQVFLNLVLNAADAFDGPHDDNLIEVEITRADDGAAVVITIADNGRGIPAEVLGRIFEPLFTTRPVGAGTGLGLWICRSIVTELGGTLLATSEVGVGSRMVVRLPVADRS